MSGHLSIHNKQTALFVRLTDLTKEEKFVDRKDERSSGRKNERSSGSNMEDTLLYVFEYFHGIDTVANVSLVLVDQRCHFGDTTCVFTRPSAEFTSSPDQTHTIIKSHGDGSEDSLQE